MGNFDDRRGSIVPSFDLGKLHSSIKITPLFQQKFDGIRDAIESEINQRMAGLKEDEELLVYFVTSDGERIGVHRILFPNWYSVRLIGVDASGNQTSVMAAIETIQLIYKVMKVAPPRKPNRIGFLQPFGE